MIVDRNRFGDSEIKSCKQCGRRLHPEYNMSGMHGNESV